MWKVFKVNKKGTSKTRVNFCSTLVRFEQTLRLVRVLLWPFFEKQVNIRCGIGSILMSITSHIHNAAKNAIAKNSCRSNFKKIEVLFSRKPQGAIRTDWKILSCIVVMIFQVAISLSIFSTTRPSLTQCRKQWFYI